MIAEYPDGGHPKVFRHDGKVAVISQGAGEDDHGFLLNPASAIELATKLLAAVADLCVDEGRVGFAHPVDSIDLKAADLPGIREGIVTFRLNGAPVRGILTPTQVAEIAAGFTAASKWLDHHPGLPRIDR